MPRFKASIYIETDTRIQAEHTLQELIGYHGLPWSNVDPVTEDDYDAYVTKTPYALVIEEPKRYQIVSNYGTFEISKIVTADSENEAWAEAGIMADLMNAGWNCNAAPDGEEHTVTEYQEEPFDEV